MHAPQAPVVLKPAHPRARYVNLGRTARDQVQGYAERKGMSVAQVEKWPRPNVAYDPHEAASEAAE